MIKNQIQTLLTKEMTRQGFLKYVGGVVLAAVGVSGLIRVLLNTSQSSSTEKRSNGYGSSRYGN